MRRQLDLGILTIPDGKIADYIDGSFRNDTPEEYVRQNVEKRLVLEHKYEPDQIAVEMPIKMGSSRRRVDLAVFPQGVNHSQDNIQVIIECKGETTRPSNKNEGTEQLWSYMSACPNCSWGMWTNGKHKVVYRKVQGEDGRITREEPNDIPSRDGSIEDIDRPRRGHLKRASDDNLLISFRICHDHIYVTDGLQKQPAFFELLKLIFCKILDERSIPHPLEFFASARERSSPDGQLTVRNRISKIFERVKRSYPAIFSPSDELLLQPRSLAYVVSELQKYSLSDTHIDVKGKAYEEIVGANLRGDRGEFFTPRNVQRMMVQMLALKEDERILDPTCGTGGFLVIAMNEVIERLTGQFGRDLDKAPQELTDGQRDLLRQRIQEVASRQFFGIDINPDLVKATKMNMVMNNDGSGNIFRQDSILHPHNWEDDFRKQFAAALQVSAEAFRNPSKDLQLFDVIATNPPFGSKLPIRDPDILEQYDLGHIWRPNGDRWVITERLQGSVPPEILFIERCYQFLKPDGRMAIVLPDSILGAPGLEYVREWLLQRTRIVASIDLHKDTFEPGNTTKTSVLVLQKLTFRELTDRQRSGLMPDYRIFMAVVDHIGHDKRGNTIFVRDEYGAEVLVPEPDSVIELGHLADGAPTRRAMPRRRVVNDQTAEVSAAFARWKREEGIKW